MKLLCVVLVCLAVLVAAGCAGPNEFEDTPDEAGLRQALKDRKQLKPFRLRKASFRGNGLQAPMRGASWERLREMAYEDRGA